jgi:hypothetical protein
MAEALDPSGLITETRLTLATRRYACLLAMPHHDSLDSHSSALIVGLYEL